MKCKDKPFISSEANIKSSLLSKGIIDEYHTILNKEEFNKISRTLDKHAKDTYGIKSNFINDINGKVVVNKEATNIIDFINGENVDLQNNQYIRQVRSANVQDHKDLSKINDTRRRLDEIESGENVLYDPSFNIFHDINSSLVPRGDVAQLKNLKINSLRIGKNKLAELIARIKRERGNEAEYAKLVKQANDLREYLFGDEHKNIQGLEKEIQEIEKIDSRSPELIEPYIRKELDRLKYLVESNDAKDNNEARKLIEFITKMGDFSNPSEIYNNGHPIYEYDELFDKDGNFLLQDIMSQPFKDWKAEAEEFKRQLDSKSIKLVEAAVNSLEQVKKGYGNLSFKDLTADLKDAHWIDMMVMDISSGILSHNGLLPQSIKIIVNDTFEKHDAWSKKIVEKIDALLPNVEKRLRELGYGFGVPGMKGVKYTLFRQEYKDGNKTRELVYKYSPEYQDAKNRMINKFWKMKNNAENATGMNRIIGLTHAYKMRNAWINKNTLLINPALLQELKDDPELLQLTNLFLTNQSEIDNHTKKIKDLVGNTHYEEIIKTQKKLLKEYKVQLNNRIADLTEQEGKQLGQELSEAGKAKLRIWEASYSPFSAIDSTKTNTPISIGNNNVFPADLRFNSYVPLRTINNQSTDYYDSKYEKIENDSILKEFYDTIYEATSGMMERFDHDTQQKLTATTVPFQERNFIDLFSDEDIKFFEALGISFVKMFDKFKNAFGIKRQSNESTEMISGISRKPEDKINDDFISKNVDKIDKLFKIRSYKFLSNYNAGRKKPLFNMNKVQLSNSQLRKITKNTIINLTNENINDVLELLHPYLRTNNYKIGDEIPVGKIIYNAAQNDIVSEQSFDLPKIIKVYSDATAKYAARQEMLPLIQIMKNYYQGTKKQQTTNIGIPIFNKLLGKHHITGLRDKANSQFENYYGRVILGNFGIRNHYGIKSTKLYNAEERKLIEEIDEALKTETDVTKISELTNTKLQLGKNVAASAVIDSMLNLVRFTGLAWNISSGLNNFINGQVDNVIAASSNQYFPSQYLDTITSQELIYGNTVGIVSKKNIPEKVMRARLIMERYDLLKDASNELQKASTKGAFSGLKRFNPFYPLKKGEDYNQTPINIAILKDTKIKDDKGNESTVWDALQAYYNKEHKQWDLKLKDEFRTKDNIANWEHADGKDYFEFKNRATNAITDIHGDFDPRSGMMAKSFQAGQALLMFKTWMPRQFYTRFAVEQDKLGSNVKSYKGRYRSHSATSMGTFAGMAGLVAFGPFGGLIAAGMGALGVSFIGTKNSLSMIQEMYHLHRLLTRKMLGFPLNKISKLISGKNIIEEDWNKLYNKMKSSDFTQQDFERYKANIQEMAIACIYIGLLLLTKAALWDDDDDENDTRRFWHNIFANRFIALSNELTSYIDPVESYKNVSTLAAFRLGMNISKLILNFNSFLEGHDTIPTGIHAGESAVGNQFKRTFLPGLISDPLNFGFKKQGQQQFQKLPIDRYFWGEEKISKQTLRQEKAYEKKLIEDALDSEDLTEQQREIKEKAAMKILNKEFHKGKHQTYKQKLEQHKERQKLNKQTQ